MFDIGWQELFIIGVLALIVVGPKELPKTIKTVTGMVRKAKSMAREFQSGVDEMVREADFDDVKKQITEGSDELKKDLEDTVGTDIAKDLDLSEDEAKKVVSKDDFDLDEVMEPGDDAEAKKTADLPEDDDVDDDDDDDVMPIASAPEPEKTPEKTPEETENKA
ncbi:Sec-independent protein translocase protein TatB [Magnetovibrio sp. PR-2]|uniref:Sec-independent protein translocase protein TatB n=1 Tax=Magnetovibrio sp. PR-2 TaxID=3120356 RepID=UPI002FCDEB53